MRQMLEGADFHHAKVRLIIVPLVFAVDQLQLKTRTTGAKKSI
jgi:hypothetical protein